jgi:hypothetical protein
MYELQNRMKKTGYVVAHIKEKIKEEEYTSATALRTMTWSCIMHTTRESYSILEPSRVLPTLIGCKSVNDDDVCYQHR